MQFAPISCTVQHNAARHSIDVSQPDPSASEYRCSSASTHAVGITLTDRWTGRRQLTAPVVPTGRRELDRRIAVRWALAADHPLLRLDLRGALLAGLDFSGCDLSETDLTGANLSGCGFRGAILDGTTLAGTTLVETELADAGVDTEGRRWLAVPHGDGLRLSIGETWLDMDTAWDRLALAHTALSMEAHCRLALLVQIALLRGWPVPARHAALVMGRNDTT